VKIGAAIAVLLATGLLLGIAEVAVRMNGKRKHGFGAISELYFLDPATGVVLLQPNLKTSRITSNSHGLRGPEPAMPKPEGMLRLAFLGGSTTVCHEASDDAHTWPALVTGQVATSTLAPKVDYVLGAGGGWSLMSLQTVWSKIVQPLGPDVVFIYEATNDLMMDARALAKAQGLDQGAPDKRSWLSEHSIIADLIEKNVVVLLRQSRATETAGKITVDPDVMSLGFRDRLLSLVKSVQTSGALPVLITFSSRLREGQSAEERRAALVTFAFYCPYLDGDTAVRVYAAYNARIREVAAETGAMLIDDYTAVPGDAAHYTDSVHFTDVGSEKMAARVATAFLASTEARARLSR